jgi:hypothetical protein
VRVAIFKPAAHCVGHLLQLAADRIDAAYCPRPGEAFKGRVPLQVQCLFGHFTLQRNYYYHARRQVGHYPADGVLGLETGYTPALARLIALEGADETGYQKAEQHLMETGGMAVDARQIQRVIQRVGPAAQAWQERDYTPEQTDSCDAPIMYVSADGTGIPMRQEELEGRKGKQEDGTAKTRQVYLGCVFTQHRTDELGRPVRDWNSTTYVSSMESIDDFGPVLRHEALRRGMGNVPLCVLLIDGASGLENMGHINFKDAIQIVDFYHAMEHGDGVLKTLLGSKTHPDFSRLHHTLVKRLLSNGVSRWIADIRRQSLGTPLEEPIENQLGYFLKNIGRMQYGTFRKRGLFIGSGVIEAGCKTVIGARCKYSGMFWGKPGAENVLALRCIHSSHRLKSFWKHRFAQQLAHPLDQRWAA